MIMKIEGTGIVIKGISTVVPRNSINNTQFVEKFGNRKVKMQLSVTGIMVRHVAEVDQEAKDLCYAAAERLLEHLGINRDEIKVLIFVSQTASFVTPSTAFWIQDKLHIGSECMTFDVNLGCSGYVNGLSLMATLLQNQPDGTKGLLLNGDTLSKYIDPEDIGTCMIFGDAGSATLVEAQKKQRFIGLSNSKPEGYNHLIVPDQRSYLHMDGMQVFNFSINDVVKQIREIQMIDHAVYSYYLLHQAQQYIVRNISELCHMEEEKVLTSYEDYGNVSGATIPLTFCKHFDKFPGGKDYQVLMSGFGVGLSYATASVILASPVIMPIDEI